ncbi:uncharacterized protein QC761_0026290 [Podospora bellae-mahoneyi]|uniref:Uncharacterized protein n=1 Tax=Podospora bellae-mahoneyi TaxID=2093777 RepID=A0ABR0FT54_9PEZI|nr:hypothetical protein QC761_0026290 [Podospora bellae-mahoneyi]
MVLSVLPAGSNAARKEKPRAQINEIGSLLASLRVLGPTPTRANTGKSRENNVSWGRKAMRDKLEANYQFLTSRKLLSETSRVQIRSSYFSPVLSRRNGTYILES